MCTLGHNASSSSKNITQGAEDLALENTCRTLDSDSPTYIFNNSGPFTLISIINNITNIFDQRNNNNMIKPDEICTTLISQSFCKQSLSTTDFNNLLIIQYMLYTINYYPGGPKNRTPAGTSKPRLANLSG